MKARCTLTIFKMLIFEGRLVCWYYDPHSGSLGAKGLKFQWKSKKCSAFELLQKRMPYKLRRFRITFFFWFCLTLSVPGKLKKHHFCVSNNLWVKNKLAKKINHSPLLLTLYRFLHRHYSLPSVRVSRFFISEIRILILWGKIQV